MTKNLIRQEEPGRVRVLAPGGIMIAEAYREGWLSWSWKAVRVHPDVVMTTGHSWTKRRALRQALAEADLWTSTILREIDDMLGGSAEAAEHYRKRLKKDLER